jgi:4a-hydroxytetrahydrobiopterin dehydratase
MASVVARQTLLGQFSKPLEGGKPMSAAAVKAQLRELPDWSTSEGALQRSFKFANYYETMAFLNALAYVVHREDHHPDIAYGYNQATVRFNTHSVKGISLNDFICAAKCDAVYDARVG